MASTTDSEGGKGLKGDMGKPPTTDDAWQGFILPIILGYLEGHIHLPTLLRFRFRQSFLVSLQLMIC